MIGIYCITNKINEKKYIGQSIDIENRWKFHKYHYHNNHLKNAMLKDGMDNFEYSILKTISKSGLTKILLDVYEEKYIELYNTLDKDKGYNKKHGGTNGSLSEESLKLMVETRRKNGSYNVSKECRDKISLALKGKKQTEISKIHNSISKMGHIVSEETREKIRQANLGRKNPHSGYPRSEEAKRKIGLATKGRKHSEEAKAKMRESIAQRKKEGVKHEAL
jgi:group I intron endonuclease